MKKIVSLVIAALILALTLTLTACKTNPVGSYASVSVNGKTPVDYLKESGESDAMLLLEALGLTEKEFNQRLFCVALYNDGSALVESILGVRGTGTWTLDGNKVTITTNEETYVFTLKGKKLTGTVGKAEIVMEKQQ
ncbi:MAG: lipocalin family protein [Clostridiales bacterium]|nr:lipocalin family protein [Clostridiales bacterium]